MMVSCAHCGNDEFKQVLFEGLEVFRLECKKCGDLCRFDLREVQRGTDPLVVEQELG